MTDYRYVGVADEVAFSEEDFTRHGISGQPEVKFNKDNSFTAELTNEAFEFLRGQGYSLMSVEDYESFLEAERAKQAEAEVAPVSPPPPSPADLAASPAPPSIPERPGGDATRDELASFAWTHYQIPVDTAEKNMTKSEINKALDGAEKERQKAIDAFESESTVGNEPSGQPINEGVAGDNVNTT